MAVPVFSLLTAPDPCPGTEPPRLWEIRLKEIDGLAAPIKGVWKAGEEFAAVLEERPRGLELLPRPRPRP